MGFMLSDSSMHLLNEIQDDGLTCELKSSQEEHIAPLSLHGQFHQ